MLFTTKEAAKRLKVSLAYINYLVMSETLIPEKYMGRNLYTDAELTRFEKKRNERLSKRQTVGS